MKITAIGTFRAEEFAGTAICLASDASHYVSGQIIYAEGGMTSVL